MSISEDASKIEWGAPCDYSRISSPYGWRIHPVYGDRRFHNGVDLSAPVGEREQDYGGRDNKASNWGELWENTEVYAVADGTVYTANAERGGGGNVVRIDHAGGFRSTYLHFGDPDNPNSYKFPIKRGDPVKKGALIGYMGSTGTSTGKHLHLSILYKGEYVNPMDYISGAPLPNPDITDEHRFDVPENTDENYTPLEIVNGSVEGSSKQFHIRRGKLLEMSYVPLYVNNKFDNELYVGHGFFGLNSNYISIDETSMDTSNDDDWKVATDISYSKNTNLAYCIVRANEILSSKKLSFLPSISDKNWYDYNATNNKFEYGKLPSTGSIICWTNVKDNTTKVAIVESSLGSDTVKVSEYKENKIVATTINNANKNWGQNKREYKFLGFIYLLGNSNSNTTINNNGINFKLSSGDSDTYHSFVIGLRDVKHINSVKVKYKVTPGSSGTCHVCLSQNIWNDTQLGSAEAGMEHWPLTKPQVTTDYYLPPIDKLTKYSFPFPNGCLTMGSIDASKNGIHSNTYEINADVFKPSSDYVPFIRNANTYLSFILKVSANKSADITLQEIILCG